MRVTWYFGPNWQTCTVYLDSESHTIAAAKGGDRWEEWAEHDPLHLGLAIGLGLRTSPTLERLAHKDGTKASDELVALEEALVLKAQEFIAQARAEGHLPEGWLAQ